MEQGMTHMRESTSLNGVLAYGGEGAKPEPAKEKPAEKPADKPKDGAEPGKKG